MSQPYIDELPESEQVQSLASQVAELLKNRIGFTEAMSAVVTHRYGGRFSHLRQKVQRNLNARSVATTKKHATRGQTEFAF